MKRKRDTTTDDSLPNCTPRTSKNRYGKRYKFPDRREVEQSVCSSFYLCHLEFFNKLAGFCNDTQKSEKESLPKKALCKCCDECHFDKKSNKGFYGCKNC
jgi:hypothetical protein